MPRSGRAFGFGFTDVRQLLASGVLPAPPASGASRRATGATTTRPTADARPFGSLDSSSPRGPHSEYAGSDAHRPGRVPVSSMDWHGDASVARKLSPASARNRSPAPSDTATTCPAGSSRSTSPVPIAWVRRNGDKQARCKISSKYALPIPSTTSGAVRARFNARLRRCRTAASASGFAVLRSIPRPAKRVYACSPRRQVEQGPRLGSASASAPMPAGKRKVASRHALPRDGPLSARIRGRPT
jgi:hypothetical protein